MFSSKRWGILKTSDAWYGACPQYFPRSPDIFLCSYLGGVFVRPFPHLNPQSLFHGEYQKGKYNDKVEYPAESKESECMPLLLSEAPTPKHNDL